MKRFKLRPLPAAVLSLAFAAFLAACVSGPVTAPDDMPPAKIIQKAQEASDVNKYKTALQYYEILRERHGDTGEFFAVAEYEIAFIRYKQKRYAESRLGFMNLIARYGGPGGESLPPQFKVLSEKMLARLTELGH
ncbi:MAG: hypothetical protein LBD09_05470 [Treponema sp.]|jgi:outer membrane protein assembly factor BamD (BamD/ComL family)|nr:hypothetical protein [Treponema sp.]